MIRIGTSGWSYKHWFSRFYPEDIPKKNAFDYYQRKFDTVELNVSFYRLVPRKTYEKWHSSVNENFLFAVKGSRYITHVIRLKNYEDALARFTQTLEGLENNVGPILFQLPANYHKDIAVLEIFLEGLPKKYRYAFEFRHESWLDDDVYTILKENNISFVISDSPYFPGDEVTTSDLVYIRFHGPGRLYGTNYSDKQLEAWAEKIIRWASQEKDVFAYFNNDYKAYAPKNALQLKELITKEI